MFIGGKNTVSSCSKLIDRCLSLQSPSFAESIHARLIKFGFHQHTFLGNRLIDLYSRLGAVTSALKAFDDVPCKNTFTWNILLAACSKNGSMETALWVFEEMPDRDIVSWNSMISGYVSRGLVEEAFRVLYQMRELGVRASGFTFSIAASCVPSICQAKQIHGSVIRSGLNSSNFVIGNALVDMYGKLGLVEYAFCVFRTMEEHDIVSWNAMILGCERSGHTGRALECFRSMWAAVAVFFPDQFTMSIVIHACANARDLDKGEQAFALCFKMGYLSNSIVSSAIIDMYSQCGRLDVSICFFEEMSRWDSAACNSMISGYARNGFAVEAQNLFVLALKEGFKPTEFTFASILGCISCSVPTEHGTQIHSLVLKLGSEADMIVASSLVDMYAKWGSIESAMKIFSAIAYKDLVCWNTMITGFAENGRVVETLRTFEELQAEGAQPDRITLTGVLTACSVAGLVEEGELIFSSMEEKYKIKRGVEHYACMVDLMCRAGRLTEAMEIIAAMPHKPNALVWVLLLEACRFHGNLKFAEVAAERAMELETDSSLPYSVLARMYGTRGRWESMARVWKTMKERGVKKVIGCSWISIRNQIFVFRADQLLHFGGEAMYLMLRLLSSEMEIGRGVPQHDPLVVDSEE